MTKLERTVKRTTKGKWRDLVVILNPGAMGPDGHSAWIELREFRRRSGLSITLDALYLILAEREAARKRAERRSRRVRGTRGSAL